MKHHERIVLAKKSLLGVSIGNSFSGDYDFVPNCINKSEIPPTKWEFTDDTVMAIAVCEQMERNKKIDQDELTLIFSNNHDKDVNRGYGFTAEKFKDSYL